MRLAFLLIMPLLVMGCVQDVTEGVSNVDENKTITIMNCSGIIGEMVNVTKYATMAQPTYLNNYSGSFLDCRFGYRVGENVNHAYCTGRVTRTNIDENGTIRGRDEYGMWLELEKIEELDLYWDNYRLIFSECK